MESRTLLTTGEIADLLRQPPSRITYIISKYRLKPAARVGIIRLFNAKQVQAIRVALAAMHAGKIGVKYEDS